MAWTYDATDLDPDTASGRLNIVRLLVGDNDTNDQQVDNDEITYALSVASNNTYGAAAFVAKTIASKYARKVDIELDGALSANYSDLVKQYNSLSDTYEKEAKKSGSAIGVAAGGISIARINSIREDTDRVQGSFRRDRFKNPPGYDSSVDYD